MSYNVRWNYARGLFYITPDRTLVISTRMPEDMLERFLAQAEKERKQIQENHKKGRFSSRDLMDYVKIEYEDFDDR